MMIRTVALLAFVLLAGYAAGNTIRENEDIVVEEVLIPLDAVDSDVQSMEANVNPAIVTLQGVSPPRQCAGVGQAVRIF